MRESPIDLNTTSRALSNIRVKIAHAKDQSRKSINNVSTQRSSIVLQEIDFLQQVLDPDSSENRMHRKLALFNLRAGGSEPS